jgi:hypothetical protein
MSYDNSNRAKPPSSVAHAQSPFGEMSAMRQRSAAPRAFNANAGAAFAPRHAAEEQARPAAAEARPAGRPVPGWAAGAGALLAERFAWRKIAIVLVVLALLHALRLWVFGSHSVVEGAELEAYQRHVSRVVSAVGSYSGFSVRDYTRDDWKRGFPLEIAQHLEECLARSDRVGSVVSGVGCRNFDGVNVRFFHLAVDARENATTPVTHMISPLYVPGLEYPVLSETGQSFKEAIRLRASAVPEAAVYKVTEVDAHCPLAGGAGFRSAVRDRFVAITVFYATLYGQVHRVHLTGGPAFELQHYVDVFLGRLPC